MAQTHDQRNRERTAELFDDAARGDFGQRLCGVTVAAVAVALIETASLTFNNQSQHSGDTRWMNPNSQKKESNKSSQNF